MKFDCGCFKDRRIERERRWLAKKFEWQTRFAWLPVRIGPHDCRWLEFYFERLVSWRRWGNNPEDAYTRETDLTTPQAVYDLNRLDDQFDDFKWEVLPAERWQEIRERS